MAPTVFKLIKQKERFLEYSLLPSEKRRNYISFLEFNAFYEFTYVLL